MKKRKRKSLGYGQNTPKTNTSNYTILYQIRVWFQNANQLNAKVILVKLMGFGSDSEPNQTPTPPPNLQLYHLLPLPNFVSSPICKLQCHIAVRHDNRNNYQWETMASSCSSKQSQKAVNSAFCFPNFQIYLIMIVPCPLQYHILILGLLIPILESCYNIHVCAREVG